ncbi:MAG: hydrogenase maturation protease [Actinomycetes bacterium]|jgi:hydrogenase maturation protease|nr:hydrogenase maturation protease [Actinomycetes bacterium]
MLPRILILGVGSVITADDAVGPAVIDFLQRHCEFPENVALESLEVKGMGMLPWLEAIDHLIVVDAVTGTEHPPGTVLLFSPDEIAPNQVGTAHDVGLPAVLQAAALTGNEIASTVVIAVQAQRLEQFVMELSPSVAAAVSTAAQAVLDELARLGVTPVRITDAPIDDGAEGTGQHRIGHE